jgi:alpha-galactosidase
LGVGGHLLHWSEADRADAARLIALYKQIRSVVQFGDQYRLRSAQHEPFSAVSYVSKDRREGVLFAFRTHIPDPAILPPLYLRGLDPQALYTIEGFDVACSGTSWMNAGLTVQLRDFQSTVRKIKRVG